MTATIKRLMRSLFVRIAGRVFYREELVPGRHKTPINLSVCGSLHFSKIYFSALSPGLAFDAPLLGCMYIPTSEQTSSGYIFVYLFPM